jgi:predicted kinase
MKPQTPTTPHVIIMVGIPGAGKTHFAEHFASMFGAPYLNLPAIQAMTELPDRKVLELSSHMLTELLKTGRTVIFEGPSHSRQFREALVKKIRKAGYEPLIVWVQTESGEAMARSMKNNPELTVADYEAGIQQFNAPTDKEKGVVISGRHTYATQIRAVLRRLAGERPVIVKKSDPIEQTPKTPDDKPPRPPRQHSPRSTSIRIR